VRAIVLAAIDLLVVTTTRGGYSRNSNLQALLPASGSDPPLWPTNRESGEERGEERGDGRVLV
jgi:hypothetical protein